MIPAFIIALFCPVRISHALELSHASWDHVLKINVQKGLVDYKGLTANPQELRDYLGAIGLVKESDYAALSRADKIAFWINAYNAFTLKAIVDHYPIQPSFSASLRFPKKSIRQIPGVWDELKFPVMGRGMTLNEIEHGTLRKQFQEPRVHMALVCASLGCPILRGEAYTGPKLEQQLEEQARAFLEVPTKFRLDRDGKRVYLSPIFKWFGEDFIKSYSPEQGFEGRAASERAVLTFISRYRNEKDAAFLCEEKFAVKYQDYDWSLNEKGSP